MRKNIVFGFSLLSLCLMSGCSDTIKEPPVVEQEKSLFSYINEKKDSDDYVLTITGEGHSPMSSTTYNRRISYSKNAIKFEEIYSSYSVISGYINKNDAVYTFKQKDGKYKLDNIIEQSSDYHSLVYSLSNLKLDTYLEYENNNYNFELGVDASGNPIKFVDYYNVFVLANMLKIGTQIDYVAGAKLSFNKDTEKLTLELISYLENSYGNDYLNTYRVDIAFTNNTDDVISSLDNSTLSKEPLNEKFSIIKELCELGYGIKNYSMNGSDGNGNTMKINGDIYINDDYCVFDYSKEAYQAIQGYINYENAVYSIQPNGTSVSIQKVISKKDIMDFNKQNNSSYTSIDFMRILFNQTFDIIPIENTSLYQNEKYVEYNANLDLFYSEDFFDLLGFSANVDESMYTSMLNPSIRPLSFTLSYKEYGDASTKNDDLINVGYIAYKGNKEGNGIAYEGNYRMYSYSNFGCRNDLMEFALEYTLPNM